MKMSPVTAIIIVFVTLVHVVVIAAVSPLVLVPVDGVGTDSGNTSIPKNVAIKNSVAAVDLPTEIDFEVEKDIIVSEKPSDSVVLTHPLRIPSSPEKEDSPSEVNSSDVSDPKDPVARPRPNQGEFAKRIKSPHLARILSGGPKAEEITEPEKSASSELSMKSSIPARQNPRQITPISGL